MKKIGVFVDRWMSGGIESYLVSNFEQMDFSDIKIDIVTTRKLSNLYDERLQSLDISIKELLPNKKDSELTRTLLSQKAFKELMLVEHYDVLHLNIYNGVSLVYSKIAKECGVKRIIAHSHNSSMGQVRLRTVKVLAHNIGKKKYEKFITDYWACSDLAGNWLFTKKYQDKITFMNNGIDTAKFRYSKNKRMLFREKHKLSDEDFVLGNIGRLNNQKNQLFLLDIALELRKKGVSFTLLVAGEGELKERIQYKIYEYNLINEVKLIGTIKDTSEFYSGIDLFLLPSLFEGNPIVGFEAQCSGVKCILSDRITKQAKVIEKTEFHSLSNLTDWVETIELFREGGHNRGLSYHSVKDNQYDINDTSQILKVNLVE